MEQRNKRSSEESTTEAGSSFYKAFRSKLFPVKDSDSELVKFFKSSAFIISIVLVSGIFLSVALLAL
jgi:hypothetical protein